jgi:putative MFS transporter
MAGETDRITSPGPGAGATLSARVIAARLDGLPFTRWHRRMVVLIGFGSFWNVFEVALGSFLGPLLKAQWSLSTVQLSLVIGAAFFGEMIGSLVLAPAADRFGRRALFKFNLLFYAASSIATALSPNLAVFLVLRVLTGVGLGAELTLVDTYLSELLPRRRRGRYIAWSYTLGLCAAPIAGILAKTAAHPVAGVEGWRWLLGLAAVGAAGVWALRRRMPESPRWLAATGDLAQASRALRGIEEHAGTADLDITPSGAETDRAPSPSETAARSGRYRLRAVMLWTMQVLGPIGFYGFASIAPVVLQDKGIDLTHSLMYSALIALGYPLGSLATVPLSERFERRTLVAVCTVAVAAFGVAFGAGSATMIVIAAGFASSVAGIMQSNFAHIYQAELFRTANRSTAIGLPYAASRLLSGLLPLAALPILTALGATALYTGCAALLTAMAVVVLTIGPRTNNRALDTI